MKSTTTILASLLMGVVAATAGEPAPAPVTTGKGPVPPPPPMDPCAGPISYNNVELLYQYTDWSGRNSENGNGGILRFEYSPTPYFYVTGGIEYDETNYGLDPDDPIVNPLGIPGGVDGADVDFQQWHLHLGIGGHFPLTPHIDLAADAGAVWRERTIDVNIPGPDNNFSQTEDDWGWYASPQLRGKWGCFTAKIGATYRDVGNDEDWTYFAAVYYQINPAWDLTVGYRHNDDFDAVSGGVRWRY